MRRHETDLAALVVGVAYVAIGIIVLATSRDRVADALPWIWSATALAFGAALLVRSAREDSPGHEVGTERGEDREVQQAGGGHDR